MSDAKPTPETRAGPPWGGILGFLALAAALRWPLRHEPFLYNSVLFIGGYLLLQVYLLAGRAAAGAARLGELQREVAGLQRELAAWRGESDLAAPAPPVGEAEVPAPAPPVEMAEPAPPPLPEPEFEPPAPTSRPAAPARPRRDWEAAWRSLAGPLAGGGREAAGAEARLGMVWLSRIGVLLLIAGGILGYRYGVTDNTVRLIIGYLAGLGLLGLGFWGRRRGYRVWAQALTGGGMGLLYLTTIAGALLLAPPVLPQPLAFALMVLITALGTGLAVLHDSAVIGLLGMAGGYLTALSLCSGAENAGLLFGYVTVLAASMLLVAHFKRWPVYNYLVAAATWAVYAAWRHAAFEPAQARAAFLFITGFLLISTLAALTFSLVQRRRARYPEVGLAALNAFAYFGAGLDLMAPAHTVMSGFLAFGLAALYLGWGVLVYRRHREDRLLALSFLGLAAVFLTVAFPVALRGPWITVAWALEGAVLVWMAFATGVKEVRHGGVLVLLLAAARLAVWDTFPQAFAMPLPAPALRAFTFLAAAAAFYLAAMAYRRFRGSPAVLAALVVAGNLFTLWYLSLEVILAYRGLPGAAAASCLALAGVWGLYGLALALADLGFRQPGLRWGMRLVLAVALSLLVAGGLSGPWAALGPVRYGGVVAIGCAWLAELVTRRRGLDPRANGVLSLAATVIGFFLVGAEVFQRLEPALALPIGQIPTPQLLAWQRSTHVFALAAAWGACAALVMTAGLLLAAPAARVLAACFSYLATFVLAVGGAANLAAHPGLRAVAFVLAVGAGAYLSTFIASRARRRPPWEVAVVAYAALAAALLTAGWGAAEIAARFGDPGLGNFGALLWLGLYALLAGRAGVWLRCPEARWLGIGLQGVTLLGLGLALTRLPASVPLRLAVFVAAILGVYAAHRVFRIAGAGRGEGRAVTWLSLAACALTVVWLGFEIGEVFPVLPQQAPALRQAALAARNHWILLAMGLYGLAVTGAGLWLRAVEARWLGLGIQVIAVAGGLTVGLAHPAAPHWLRAAAFTAALGGLYAATWLLARFPGRASLAEGRAAGRLSLAGAATTVIWLTHQAQAYFRPFITAGSPAERALALSAQDFSISALWGLYGFGVLAVGFLLGSRWTRLLGLGVLVLTLGKIGVRDMWQLAVVGRIWITVGLGCLFVMASFLYQRFGRAILGEGREVRS